MNVIREFAKDAEVPLRGFAPSAEAAKVLEKESGIRAQTVAGCLAESLARTNYRKGELWIVDEAGLLSARDCERLMHRAQLMGTRIAFVGDTRQLSAVEAGNPFRLMQRNGIETAVLSESRRQKNEELKRSVDLMATGNAKEAVEALKGQIVELKRETTRARYITKEYLNASPEERARTLILAGTNRERAVITDEIRTRLKAENALGPALQIVTLRAKDMSREEMAKAAKFSVGDVLVFHKERGRPGIQRNEHCEVVSVEDGTNQLAVRRPNGRLVSVLPEDHRDCFLAYEKVALEVAEGDKLKWTRNDRVLGVRNGEECSVVRVDGSSLGLKNSDGRVLEFGDKALLHIDHNYVHTVFSSQGKTCDRVVISVDRTFGQEAMYVALSRARFEAKIVTPDREEMLTTISQSRAKLSALEVVSESTLSHELNETRQHSQEIRMR
jgi:ATP-dependent exoDNAse (exonuclease V) alpha subunit